MFPIKTDSRISNVGWAIVCLIALVSPALANCESESKTFGEGIRCLQKKIDALNETQVRSNATAALPIGTVIASMLAPKDFAKVMVDDSAYDTRRTQWVPADGRSVAGSKYASIVTTTVPDIRGLFIRSLNYSEPDRNRQSTDPVWADPDLTRQAGTAQSDSLKEHAVTFPGRHQVMTGSTGFWTLSPQVYNGPATVQAAGDKETRPKNIALYHYIKIN